MNTGLKRSNKEQYFTKQKVSKELIHILNEFHPINKFDIIIEPSAGSGSFLKELNNFETKKIISYDIEPKYKNIIKQDYLELDLKYKNCLVIGNPPFGRQSGLAKKFIKKSCNFCDVIAFILPKSFKKKSMYNCFDLYFHKVFEKDLELNSFEFESKEYSVPCVFQIWKKRNI